jgi:hypothetical protein
MGAPAQRTPLEDPEVAQAYEQLRSSVGPKEFTDEVLSATEQANPELVAQFKQALSQQQLPAELVAALQDMLQLIFENPGDYPEIRQALLAEGVPEDLLPETFDIEFFTALRMALEQVQGTVPQQPMGFAEGGVVSLHPIARELQKFGREGDTMLAHINPVEAQMLKRMGGSGTTNPYTGLPEFFIKKVARSVGKAITGTVKAVGNVISSTAKAVTNVVKSVVKEVKRFVKSDVGRIVVTIAAAYFLGPAAASAMGVTSTAGVAAVSGFVGSFSSGMAAGDGLKKSLRAGATGAVIAGSLAVATGGTGAFAENSYTGPKTISGQYDKLKDTLGLGTPTLDTAAADVTAAGPRDFSFGPGDELITQPTPIGPGTGATSFSPQLIDPNTGLPLNVGPSQVSPFSDAQLNDVLSGARSGQELAQRGINVAGTPPGTLANTGGNAYSFGPSGDLVAPSTPIGSGTGATSFAAPSGSYDLTGDFANLNPSGEFNITGNYLKQQIPGVTIPSAGQAGIGTLPGAQAASTSAQPGFFEQLGQGDLTGAAKTGYQNVVNFYNPQPGVVTQAQLNSAAVDMGYSSFNTAPATVQNSILKSAQAAAAPMLGTTSRLALTGLGAAYAGGMFAPPPEPEVPEGFSGPTGSELLEQDPGRYGVTPGGASSQYFASYPGMAPTQVGYGPSNIYYNQSGYAPSQAPAGQGVFSLRPPMLQELDLRGYNPMGIAGLAPRRYNMGGFVPGYKKGGSPTRMSDYPRRTGAINGPGTNTSDSIPAMLSDGEFVFTADAVRGAGGGSRREGARKMYAMMKALERKA